jgi:acyl carrier protein phosphodiesterase
MNWLAHVYLSEPHIDFRLGNLLADIVRGDERASLSEEFQRGARRHHRIDAFTDAHPIVRRSRQRIRPEYRRFSGVFVDIFYDHFLASSWAQYAATDLESFTASFYADAAGSTLVLPPQAATSIERIARYDLLGSYRDIDGVERALRGVSMRLQRRWGRDFQLHAGVADLIEQRAAFAVDFAEFFPELQTHVMSRG